MKLLPARSNVARTVRLLFVIILFPFFFAFELSKPLIPYLAALTGLILVICFHNVVFGAFAIMVVVSFLMMAWEFVAEEAKKSRWWVKALLFMLWVVLFSVVTILSSIQCNIFAR